MVAAAEKYITSNIHWRVEFDGALQRKEISEIPIDPEDFINGGERPIRRNPLITSILYSSKDVESFGTGLKRIADACHEAECRFESKILKSGFVGVFYRSGLDPSPKGYLLQIFDFLQFGSAQAGNFCTK